MYNASNVAIVGAGLVGRLLAYQLNRLNYQVTLYEADKLIPVAEANRLSAAAFTAAGMIAPISEAIEADLNTYHLGRTSLLLWPSIIQQLNISCSQPIDYHQAGSLIICHPQDSAELTHFQRQVHQLSKHTAIAYQTLNQQQINHLEPDLANRFASGLLLEDEAHIDNRQLLNVLISECIENGVKIVDQQTVDIVDNSICSSGEKVSYDWVFDCRGTGAKKQLANLRGVRGEVLRVHCPAVKLSRPVRLMHPRYQLYLVPKPDQHFVIGATQIESEDTSPVSVQSMLELCSAMYSINPAFAEARIVEQNTNLRPALADNKPQILVNQQQVSINGLFRHGFLIAPAIVNSVIDWLDGKECPHFNSLFSFSE